MLKICIFLIFCFLFSDATIIPFVIKKNTDFNFDSNSRFKIDSNLYFDTKTGSKANGEYIFKKTSKIKIIDVFQDGRYNKRKIEEYYPNIIVYKEKSMFPYFKPDYTYKEAIYSKNKVLLETFNANNADAISFEEWKKYEKNILKEISTYKSNTKFNSYSNTVFYSPDVLPEKIKEVHEQKEEYFGNNCENDSCEKNTHKNLYYFEDGRSLELYYYDVGYTKNNKKDTSFYSFKEFDKNNNQIKFYSSVVNYSDKSSLEYKFEELYKLTIQDNIDSKNKLIQIEKEITEINGGNETKKESELKDIKDNESLLKTIIIVTSIFVFIIALGAISLFIEEKFFKKSELE